MVEQEFITLYIEKMSNKLSESLKKEIMQEVHIELLLKANKELTEEINKFKTKEPIDLPNFRINKAEVNTF